MSDEIETADEMDGPRYVEAVRGGLTVAGKVLAVGDVVELPAPGTDEHAATCDRRGRSWCDDLSSAAQRRRWGAVFLVEHSAPAERDDEHPDDEPNPARGVPIRPDAVGPVAGPRNRRWTPEGSVPLIIGLGGSGPVTIHPAAR